MRSLLRIALLLAMCVGVLSFASLAASTDGHMTISVIDVGQGDAILIRGPDGFAVLVDAGPPPRCPSQYLLQHNVTRLDVVVLTHPHADHVGCMAQVLTSFPTDLLLHNGQSGTSQSYFAFATAVAIQGIPTVIMRAGQTLAWGCCVSAVVLNPSDLSASVNDNSVVLRVSYGNVHVLLTGDVSEQAEAAMLGRGWPLGSQLLKVAHHGSKYSSSSAFLSAVAPQYAAISVGVNPYGHPAPETLARLAAAGARVARTDQAGSITYHADGNDVRPAYHPYTVFLPIVVRDPDPPTATPTPTRTATVPLPADPTATATAVVAPTSTPTPPAMPGQNVQCQTFGTAEICASVSNATPAQYSNVTVYGRLRIAGVGQGGLAMNATWHYRTSTPTCSGTTGPDGSAQCTRSISGATKGYTVNVDVAIGGYQATTSFTPQ